MRTMNRYAGNRALIMKLFAVRHRPPLPPSAASRTHSSPPTPRQVLFFFIVIFGAFFA